MKKFMLRSTGVVELDINFRTSIISINKYPGFVSLLIKINTSALPHYCEWWVCLVVYFHINNFISENIVITGSVRTLSFDLNNFKFSNSKTFTSAVHIKSHKLQDKEYKLIKFSCSEHWYRNLFDAQRNSNIKHVI